jgi:hypothetical protein
MSAQIIHEPFPRSKSEDDMVRNLAGIFEGLPPVRKEHLPPLLNPNQGQCVFCKRFTPLKTMPIVNTGIVFAQEPLCTECIQRFKDQARIVCTECKQVILWVDPGKERSGFEFKRRHSYHVRNCPTCKPGVTCAKVLEKVVYFNENNIPYE